MEQVDQRLASALREAACGDLARAAERGEFSDFRSHHALPKMALAEALRVRGTSMALALRDRVIDGDFDG